MRTVLRPGERVSARGHLAPRLSGRRCAAAGRLGFWGAGARTWNLSWRSSFNEADPAEAFSCTIACTARSTSALGGAGLESCRVPWMSGFDTRRSIFAVFSTLRVEKAGLQRGEGSLRQCCA